MRSTPPIPWDKHPHERPFRTQYELEQKIDAHEQASGNVDSMFTNVLVCG
jgi:hypothetical protein